MRAESPAEALKPTIVAFAAISCSQSIKIDVKQEAMPRMCYEIGCMSTHIITDVLHKRTQVNVQR